jgi:methyltransferase family protein
MNLTAEQRSNLDALAHRLEEDVQARGELVLSSMEWDLDGPNAQYTPDDPYLGISPEFLDIIQKLCGSEQAWIELYLTLLVELARGGELRDRFVRLSDKLWMKTHYRGRTIWHTAFPPLDGGGSSQARVFYQYLRSRYVGKAATCFEWCCGPGFLGFMALWEGFCEELVLADINPGIALGIERTIQENSLEGRVRYYVSDNLKQLPETEKFDLVLGNPPWAYREIPDLPNPLIPNDPEWKIHREFFEQLPRHLNAGAQVCISAYEPFREVAYIELQKEPWDIRPRPPIVDFRTFLEKSDLAVRDIHRPLPDPQVSYSQGMTLFMIERVASESVPSRPDLIGLGGRREAESTETFKFDLTVARGLPLNQMMQHSIQMDALRTGVSQTLIDHHLTRVLRDLFGNPVAATTALLQALQIPPAIASAFPDWNNPNDFRYEPPVVGLRLTSETCQAQVTKLRLQLGQDAPVSVGLRMLRSLLRQLPESIKFHVLVKPGFDESVTREFLESFQGYTSHRVTFFEHGHQTLFAQDNGRLAVRPDGSQSILVPGYLSTHRPADALVSAPLPLIRSRLHWEGGNVLCDGHRVLIGANSVATNMRAFGLTAEQVEQAFEAEMGFPVVTLGDVQAAFKGMVQGERGAAVAHAVDGGQADFHIDLDCCLLGAADCGTHRVVLADPERGLNYLPEILEIDRLFQGHCVSPNLARKMFQQAAEDSVVRRGPLLDMYARALQAAGYQVCRVPDLRLISDVNYLARTQTMFSYCNALTLRLGTRATVALLTCGVKELEAEVSRVYELQGVDVLWIGDRLMAEDLLSMRGGLHCFCSVMG